ncbi:MAG: hypothetical protein AAF581_12175 [Planctomycetota bacterium]
MKRQTARRTPVNNRTISHRVCRTTLAALLFGAVALLGCQSTLLPEDVHDLYISARNAEAENRHANAIIFYSDILGKYKDASEVLLARGESYMKLAAEQEPSARAQSLASALDDFQRAEAATDDEPTLISSRILQVLCLVELRQSAAAQDVLHVLLSHEQLTSLQRADANRTLGTLLLEDLHEQIEIDAVLTTKATNELALCREARHHFGEALTLASGDGRSSFGKGLCLFHEQLFEEAQRFLVAARTQGFKQQPALAHMIASVREARVGVNAESLEGYLLALRLDSDELAFTPVYKKIYALLEQGHLALDNDRQPLKQLLEYRGSSVTLWQQARDFCRSAETETHLLGRAVAASRLSDPTNAQAAFHRWRQRTQLPIAEQTRALELIFGTPPLRDDRVARTAISLERARGYWLLFPDDPAGRAPARAELLQWINALQLQERSSERDRLLAESSGLLADDLVALAANPELEQEERERLLREAQTLSLAEQHLRDHYLVDFRLGRIDQLLQGDTTFPLAPALQTAQGDPSHSYTPAYTVLAQWREQKQSYAPTPASYREDEVDAQLLQTQTTLAEYDGNEPQLLSFATEMITNGGFYPDLNAALARHYRSAQIVAGEDEELDRYLAQLRAIEDEILRYRGKDRRVLEQAAAIASERAADQRATELLALLAGDAQRRHVEAAKEAEIEARFGDPCPDCGKRPLRSDQICPACGCTLPSG